MKPFRLVAVALMLASFSACAPCSDGEVSQETRVDSHLDFDIEVHVCVIEPHGGTYERWIWIDAGLVGSLPVGRRPYEDWERADECEPALGKVEYVGLELMRGEDDVRFCYRDSDTTDIVVVDRHEYCPWGWHERAPVFMC